MRPIVTLFALIWVLSTSAAATAAETLATREDIRQQTGAFMDMIASGRIVAAYNSLRPYLGITAVAHDASAKEAAAHFQQLQQDIGRPVGSSRVRNEVIADDFTREIWLQKFESAAIAWRLTFYQPDVSGWKLVEISYSPELDALFRLPE